MLLRTSNLTFSCGSRNVLDKVSFALGAQEKVGLIGPTGCGKTTLLKLLARGLEPDDGEIRVAPDVEIGYLQQFIPSESKVTVYEKLFGKATELERRIATLSRTLTRYPDDDGARAKYEALKEELSSRFGPSFRQRLEKTLDSLGVSRSRYRCRVSDLLPSEQAALELAQLLVREADLLILDEPSYQLDITQRESVGRLLAAFPGSILLADRDRALLDSVVNRILELRNGRLLAFEGDYEDYERQRRKTLAPKRTCSEPTVCRSRTVKRSPSLKTQQEPVIRASNLTKFFVHRRILDRISFEVHFRERVGLVGPCGCGKTVLLKTLMGELRPDSGKAEFARGLEVGYVPQQQTAGSPANHPAAHIQAEPPAADVSATILSQIRQLSRECDVLVLDDPTRLLDIDSIIALEEILLEFPGTLLLATHDRTLLKRLANRLLVLNNCRIDDRTNTGSLAVSNR